MAYCSSQACTEHVVRGAAIRDESATPINICIYLLDDSLLTDAETLSQSLQNSVDDCNVKDCPHLNDANKSISTSISKTCKHFVECKEKYDVKVEEKSEKAKGKYKTMKNLAQSTTAINTSIKLSGDVVELISPNGEINDHSSPRSGSQLLGDQSDSLQSIPANSAASLSTGWLSSTSTVTPEIVPSLCEHVDVVVIFGHCSMYNCGPFPTDKLLAALIKRNPTIIAILGCCGGSDRHGPILKIMHVLNPKCVVGFYQRRVYVDELCTTSLVIGLKNYLYLASNDPKLAKEATKLAEITAAGEKKENNMSKVKFAEHKRAIAVHAFGYAQSCLSDEQAASDPTRFANNNEPFLSQIFSDARINKPGVISLSCLQLAIYHRMVVDSKKMKPIEVPCFTGNELNKCIEEIRTHHLNELIPLILELELLKLYKESLDLIRNGDKNSWQKVDHLQFLLAMLRGHWGKNTLTVVRKWATFHLMEMMDGAMKNKNCLHKYKLCCVCYALLCEDHFVRFVKQGEDYSQLKIVACTRLTDAPETSYVYSDLRGSHKLPNPDMLTGKYPVQGELPVDSCNWVELFRNCDSIPDCVNMYNSHTSDLPLMWHIKNESVIHDNCYKYSYIDFELAIIALRDHFLKVKERKQKRMRQDQTTMKFYSGVSNFFSQSSSSTIIDISDDSESDDSGEHAAPFSYKSLTINCYHVKNFNNTGDESTGIMASFPKKLWHTELTFVEMRVIIDESEFKQVDVEKLAESYFSISSMGIFPDVIKDRIKHQIGGANQNVVSACRFVFAKFNNRAAEEQGRYQGILFFTNNHYGHELIKVDNETRALLCEKCLKNPKIKEAIDKQCSRKAIPSMDNKCKIEMQKQMIKKIKDKDGDGEKIFPYQCIGRLTLTLNANTTVDVELQEVASLHSQ